MRNMNHQGVGNLRLFGDPVEIPDVVRTYMSVYCKVEHFCTVKFVVNRGSVESSIRRGHMLATPLLFYYEGTAIWRLVLKKKKNDIWMLGRNQAQAP
jgi:hypothetical protein